MMIPYANIDSIYDAKFHHYLYNFFFVQNGALLADIELVSAA